MTFFTVMCILQRYSGHYVSCLITNTIKCNVLQLKQWTVYKVCALSNSRVFVCPLSLRTDRNSLEISLVRSWIQNEILLWFSLYFRWTFKENIFFHRCLIFETNCIVEGTWCNRLSVTIKHYCIERYFTGDVAALESDMFLNFLR